MKLKQLNRWMTLLTNVGVLIGLALLIFELNQNAELMRAELHALRAEAKASRQMELANGGEVSRIMFEAISQGFPQDPGALSQLDPQDQFRARGFLAGLTEAVQNWHYQCQQELLDFELCQSGYEAQAADLIIFVHGAGLDFSSSRASFIEDLRRIATETDLPIPNEDGTWAE